MNKEKKIKFFLGITYLLIITVFLWAFFANFSLSEVTSYDFIKNRSQYFNTLKEKNFFIVSILFLLFCIVWTLLGGFGSPILLLAGFIFGKWIGSIYAAIGLSIGATLLYMFANYFLKDLIEEKFSKKFSNFHKKFKKNEFNFFLIFRFISAIPFSIANILPTIFNIKVKTYFFGTIIGLYPQIFIWASLGSGLNKIIDKNLEAPSIIEILSSKEIYFPMIGFIILVILGIIINKKYYNN
jgi:uncharacterized membrane protein YdjX (TVP38/TMEM64 family)